MPRLGPKYNLAGRTFGNWTALALSPDKSHGFSWSVKCSCGVLAVVRADQLLNGHSRSCGCLKAALMAERMWKHGGASTPTYRSWRAMINRCTDAEHVSYARYGGRGIKVCARWLESFETFLQDMGARPSLRYSIHRIENDGDYEPGNCKWATQIEQSNSRITNHVVTLDGVTSSVTSMARRLGINPVVVFSRLQDDWPIERAFKEPAAPRIWKKRTPKPDTATLPVGT